MPLSSSSSSSAYKVRIRDGHADIFTDAHRRGYAHYPTYFGYSTIYAAYFSVMHPIRIRMAIPSKDPQTPSLPVKYSIHVYFAFSLFSPPTRCSHLLAMGAQWCLSSKFFYVFLSGSGILVATMTSKYFHLVSSLICHTDCHTITLTHCHTVTAPEYVNKLFMYFFKK